MMRKISITLIILLAWIGAPDGLLAKSCEPNGSDGSQCGLLGSVQVGSVIPGVPYPTTIMGFNTDGTDLLSVDQEGVASSPPGRSVHYPCQGNCSNSAFICGLGDGIKRTMYRELLVHFPGGTRYSHFEFGLDSTGQQSLNGLVPKIKFFNMRFFEDGIDPKYTNISLNSVRNVDGTMSISVEESIIQGFVMHWRVMAEYQLPANESLLVGTATVTGKLSYMYVMTSGGAMLARFGNSVPYDKLPQVTNWFAVAQLSQSALPEKIAYGLVDIPAFTSANPGNPSTLLAFMGFWKQLADGPLDPPGLNPF